MLRIVAAEQDGLKRDLDALVRGGAPGACCWRR
jgi:hypothetical protein